LFYKNELRIFAGVLKYPRNHPPMTERISHIPDIQSSLDRLPKSQNRIVNSVRFLIALAVLSPGSCVGVGAAGSWAYKKVNDVSAVEDKKNDSRKNPADEIMEWIRDSLASVQ